MNEVPWLWVSVGSFFLGWLFTILSRYTVLYEDVERSSANPSPNTPTKRRITTKGLTLMISAFVGVFGGIVTLVVDRMKAEDRYAEQQTAFANVLELNEQVLLGTKRALTRISHLSVDATFQLDLDKPELLPLVQDLDDLVTVIDSPDWKIDLDSGLQVWKTDVPPRVEHIIVDLTKYPLRRTAETKWLKGVLLNPRLSVSLWREHVPGETAEYAALGIEPRQLPDLQLQPRLSPDTCRVIYFARTKTACVRWGGLQYPADEWVSNGTIRSLPDLSQVQVAVYLVPVSGYEQGNTVLRTAVPVLLRFDVDHSSVPVKGFIAGSVIWDRALFFATTPTVE